MDSSQSEVAAEMREVDPTTADEEEVGGANNNNCDWPARREADPPETPPTLPEAGFSEGLEEAWLEEQWPPAE